MIANVVCPHCADLCDDLRLEVEGDRITAVEVECQAGRAFFLGYQVETVAPRLRGADAGWEEAVEEGAAILARAIAPLVLGLSSTACEAQRAAVELAETIGACIDTPYAAFYGPRAIAIQQVGESTCTLGEVKNRADLVIVWGADPMVTHPRHLSRYAVDPPGLFVPNGRVAIILSDGTQLKLTANSTVQINQVSHRRSRKATPVIVRRIRIIVQFFLGEIRMRRAGRAGELEIETPTAIAATRASLFQFSPCADSNNSHNDAPWLHADTISPQRIEAGTVQMISEAGSRLAIRTATGSSSTLSRNGPRG